MTSGPHFDYAIVGGGLQGCLLAHAIASRKPGAAVLIVERAGEICGNHTWSFHETDVPEVSQDWFGPLARTRWPGYRVRFPGYSRRVGIAYATITAAGLREATLALTGVGRESIERWPLTLRTGVSCKILSPTDLRFADGTEVQSRIVVDCRGRAASAAGWVETGFQTFIGHEYRLAQRWPAAEPTVMDVPTNQDCGFEFLYELPLGPDRVLLEYTRFAEESACDEERAERLIQARLTEAGVEPVELLRTETGCLPMPYAPAPTAVGATIAGGYAGGWYHAATGYSMPLAVRFAELVASTPPEAVRAEIATTLAAEGRRRVFARFLNRLLFCLVKPTDRWKVFRRFYSVLSDEQIARFYAHRFTVGDAARIVIGRPPSGLAPIRFLRSFRPQTETVLT